MTLDVTTERYYAFWDAVAKIGVCGGVIIIGELAVIIFFLWKLSRGTV